MSGLSIIIPAGGAVQELEDTLASVLRNRPHDCQILVVTDGSYDDPHDLAGEVEFITAPRCETTAARVGVALPLCEAPVVHVLACGLEVDEGWCEAALHALEDPRVAAVSPLVAQRANHQIVAAGVTASRFGRRLVVAGGTIDSPSTIGVVGPTELAAFYRREPLEQAIRALGGAPSVPRDVDLALALQAMGLDTVVATESLVWLDEPARPRGRRLETVTAEWPDHREHYRRIWRYSRGRGARARATVAASIVTSLLAAPVRPRALVDALQGVAWLRAPISDRAVAGRLRMLRPEIAERIAQGWSTPLDSQPLARRRRQAA